MITLHVDEDVEVARLIKALAHAGLTMTNVDGWTFRVRRVEHAQKIIDLQARRLADAATDAKMRDGMHTAFDPPTGPDVA